MKVPEWVYEHGIAEVDVAGGPDVLLAELNEKSQEGWECFEIVTKTTKHQLDGSTHAVFMLLLRRRRINLVLPGPKGVQ